MICYTVYTGQLSVAPPLHCSRINTTNQSQGACLRSVSHARVYGSPPSPTLVQCLLSPVQVNSSSNSNCKQWQRGSSREMLDHFPRRREEIIRLTKESRVKRENWTEPECQFRGGGAADWERRSVSGFSSGQVRTPAWYVSFYVLSSRPWWRRLQ